MSIDDIPEPTDRELELMQDAVAVRLADLLMRSDDPAALDLFHEYLDIGRKLGMEL